MAQIIPQFDMGERLGRSLGQGLERGLNTLAQYKLRDVMSRMELGREADALEKIGIPREVAFMGQSKIPYLQQLFMYRPDLFQQQKPEEKMSQDLATGIEPQMQESTSAYPSQAQLLEKLNQTLMPTRQGPSNAMDTMRNALRGAMGIGMPEMGEGARQLAAMQQPTRAQAAMQPTGMQVPTPTYQTPRTRAENVRAEIEREKAERRVFERSSERSEKRVAELQAQNKAISDNLDAYDQLLTYSRSGSPISGAPAAVLQRFGLQNVFTNAPTQATNKIASATVLNNLSGIKGAGRGTNLLTNTIANANPNIFLTPLGMEAVVQPLKIKDEYQKALNEEIIAERAKYDESGKRAPINLEAQVEKRLEPLAQKKNRELVDIARRIINAEGSPHQVVEFNKTQRPDPSTYNTAKDGQYYIDETTGEKRGSDGKNDVRVEERGGRMVPVR